MFSSEFLLSGISKRQKIAKTRVLRRTSTRLITPVGWCFATFPHSVTAWNTTTAQKSLESVSCSSRFRSYLNSSSSIMKRRRKVYPPINRCCLSGFPSSWKHFERRFRMKSPRFSAQHSSPLNWRRLLILEQNDCWKTTAMWELQRSECAVKLKICLTKLCWKRWSELTIPTVKI